MADRPTRRFWLPFLATVLVTAAISAGIAALLLNVAERKREARDPYLKLVNVGEGTTDSKPWGVNWPRQFDSYLRTVDATRRKALVGTAAQVGAQMRALAASLGLDELVVNTWAHEPAVRRHSYALLAHEFGLKAADWCARSTSSCAASSSRWTPCSRPPGWRKAGATPRPWWRQGWCRWMDRRKRARRASCAPVNA